MNTEAPALNSHLRSPGACEEVRGVLDFFLRRKERLLRPRTGQSQHWVSCAPSPSSPALGGLGGANEPEEEKLRVRASLDENDIEGSDGNKVEIIMDGAGHENRMGVRDRNRTEIQ